MTFRSPWDVGSSDAALRQDIERWKRDLAQWEAAGLVDSVPAQTIRGWIDTVEKILSPPRGKP